MMCKPAANAPVRAFLARLGLAHPIVQAPMAGGATTTELVSIVCNAGALGSLAAALLPPAKIEEAVAAVRRQTDKPFAVNLFVLDDPRANEPAIAPRIAHALELLAPIRRELGLRDADLPERFCERFVDQLAAVRDAAPPVVSFTFGILDRQEVRALQSKGCVVVGTATHVAEARAWEEAGADIVCAQGAEAGAHRGTFIGAFEEAMIGTVALVPQIVQAVKIPVIAAGGIMAGRGIAAALRLGAVAAQMGTAFLTCPEAGIHPGWKQLLRGPAAGRTIVTRAFSGKPARALVNEYVERLRPHEHELPPYPIMNALTTELRAAAAKAGRPEFLSLWAGQGAALSRGLPAAELVRRLAAELADAGGF